MSIAEKAVKPRRDYDAYAAIPADGIPEYWIVDPDRQQILQLSLQDGHYAETIETTSITMKVVPIVTVDLARIWSARNL